MKALLLAGAFALLLTGGAVARDSATQRVHAHRAHKAKSIGTVRRPAPRAPQKDPYAKYWDDPTRQGPFSYYGHDVY